MPKICKFLQPYFATQSNKSLQKSYPQVLYLFGNLSWSPTWIPTRMQKFCKFFATLFCNPIIWAFCRSPTTKCYTFLETSHDPQLASQLRCKYFANFFATLFCNPTLWTLLQVLPSSVIPFWKPLMIPDLDPNSMQKFCKLICNPILQFRILNTSSSPTTKCYTFLETSHDPWLISQLRCKNFAHFFATLFFCNPTLWTLL